MSSFRKKLIEVALPLEAINREAAREKSIRHGHPSTLHLWWARRPLAACRAVLFASLVDDPSEHPERFPDDEAQEKERQRLFRIIESLVKWENSNDERVLGAARAEIRSSTDGNPPPVLDPFCGGGSIPLEALRLGLDARGSDLNPVAVLITKALVELAPSFANMPPVNPSTCSQMASGGWTGSRGLAEDIRFYGGWMREQALARVGHLYPRVQLPGGAGETNVIAWLWARTVRCPNPACGAQAPLVRSFALSRKRDKQTWVQPVVDVDAKTVEFAIQSGVGVAPDGTVNRNGARCLVCGETIGFDYIRAEGRSGLLGARLMAIAAEGVRSRLYLEPSPAQAQLAASAEPNWEPDTDLPEKALSFRVQAYGMTKHKDLFTRRQLASLSTFSELVSEVKNRVELDATDCVASHGSLDSASFSPSKYADTVATFLAFAVDRAADRGSTICSWDSSPKMEALRNTFARQAIPMTWDFAEGNPFSESSGNWLNNVEWTALVAEGLPSGCPGHVSQLDATAPREGDIAPVFSTDPPYYDNIGYADLSDYFYVWLRRSLSSIYPSLFSTLLTPKAPELVATPYRFGGNRRQAQAFFEQGLGSAFRRMREEGAHDYPVTIYYAFKQAEADIESDVGKMASTGWETMLSGLLTAGFAITGTWPMRSELSNRPVASGTNALASSVVLVCRPRDTTAPLSSRREFLSALKAELPDALRHLQHGNIAPVDLAQASIGPGMAIFSRYSKVMEADGTPMSVRTALGLINQALDDVVAEQEGEFDADTRWAIAWFQETGMEAGDFGRAELLSKAKVTSIQGMVEAGILEARAGKVRLLRRDELDEAWDPVTDERLTVWEMAQHLIHRLDDGEVVAAALARRLGATAEVARDLAYRLYLICERKKWAQEALAYNALVVAWPQIKRLAASEPSASAPSQTDLGI